MNHPGDLQRSLNLIRASFPFYFSKTLSGFVCMYETLMVNEELLLTFFIDFDWRMDSNSFRTRYHCPGVTFLRFSFEEELEDFRRVAAPWVELCSIHFWKFEASFNLNCDGMFSVD
ncbi:unnamed protein product [Auanema sp. JU1783]|nr:unnamed protein product [Auanema sp. JU1783]